MLGGYGVHRTTPSGSGSIESGSYDGPKTGDLFAALRKARVMRKAPPLSYRGALRLLGTSDQGLLKKIDKLLGGLILVSPLTPFAAAWGVVDQKNEGISLVGTLLKTATKRMGQVGGFERHEMITAAHSVVVIAAFFDTLRDQLGKAEYAQIELTDQEKSFLATGARYHESAEGLITLLSSVDIPLPADGKMMDTGELNAIYERTLGAVLTFLGSLKVSKQFSTRRNIAAELSSLPANAIKKYFSYFLDLANDVPEFYLWAILSEQRFMRKKLDAAYQDLRSATETQMSSLGRLHDILHKLNSDRIDPGTKARSSVNRANRSALTDPIIANRMLEHVGSIELPSVEHIYQNPRFCWSVAELAEPADEQWWESQPVFDDFDVFLASYLAAPHSVYEPMLVLGHPGAGKSLLARVLAARLPEDSYTTVRVPLRQVDAQAPIRDQIQQALDTSTNGRVNWVDLVDDDYYTNRVVILDGLDELLQASSTSRSSYLQEVAEFQRHEAAQERPVAFIVTSRTVVADRVRISATSTVVKLEPFNDQQIEKWLSVWRGRNRGAIDSGQMGELALDAALGARDLSCQPLLLLMLALYAADPKAEKIGPQLSGAAFYEQILTSFVEREVIKTLSVADEEIPGELVEDQMWRLGIAAYAMFNRDRLYIKDHELGADLMALTGSDVTGKDAANLQAKIGQETIGKFFFVYSAEADSHAKDDARRAFEFLHATFGEYLVAHLCVKVFIDTITLSRKAWQGGRQFDDDLLFALLSHQTFATRRTTVTFIRELFSQIASGERERHSIAISKLLTGYRSRANTTSYGDYRPLAVDRIRQVAAYSANLTLLKVLISDTGSIGLEELIPHDQTVEWWFSTVSLWRHALGEASWESICRTIDATSSNQIVLRKEEPQTVAAEALLLRFTKNDRDLINYHLGAAARGALMRSDLLPVMMRLVNYLIHATYQGEFPAANVRAEYLELARTIRKEQVSDGSLLYHAIVAYLNRWQSPLPIKEARDWIKLAMRGAIADDTSAFVFYIIRDPRLLDDIPELRDPDRYRQPWVPTLLYAAELQAKALDKNEEQSLRVVVLMLRAFREAIESSYRSSER